MGSSLQTGTLHPQLTVGLPGPLTSLPKAAREQCRASILVHLPPSLFYDPYTSYAIRRDPRIANVQILGHTELERPVGWSLSSPPPSSSVRTSAGARSWWERDYDSDEAGGTFPDDDEGLAGLVGGLLKNEVQQREGRRAEAAGLGARGNRGTGRIEDLKHEHTTVVLDLDTSALGRASGGATETIDVPLHVRYMPPSSTTSPSLVVGLERVATRMLSPAVSKWLNSAVAHIPWLSSSGPGVDTSERIDSSRTTVNEEDEGLYYRQALHPPEIVLDCPDQVDARSLKGWYPVAPDLELDLPIGDTQVAPFVQFFTVLCVFLLSGWVLSSTFRYTDKVDRHEAHQASTREKSVLGKRQ
ncbi:uncharacterized protein PFL1_06746 [Pseudozyma flocculosa PF-1]|uniref:Protein PBN1 n=1 Tax=Pseudozyma flocculosa PF-1 TaxID=1277687 RepID=A0A061H0V7_9BASI|nr:uncharacterized protein PFL1_06746 [Pseudozyma flocculosa PF-1]EPQ25674.1 hypothetical protein PFL1_06746 [Pseudozyma flocculosa PF-1]